MIKINNLFKNDNLKVIDKKGQFILLEWQKDLSVNTYTAMDSYFMQEMNVRKRQVFCSLQNTAVRVQAGAMQWTAGNVNLTSDVKGVGNLLGKMVKGAVTNESAVKPVYSGAGYLMLEPTYNYLLVEDVESWGTGMVLNDGLFLACDAHLQDTIVHRKNVSSAVLGGEGIFNLALSGQGQCVLESPVPREELFEFYLENDVLKIDGNMAIAWSSSLDFTVEKSTKSLIGSAMSGEGFVNVYRGTGKVLMAPNMPGTVNHSSNGPESKTARKGIVGNVVGAITE